ncbi:hypothetical protein B0H63DRAFT_63507 [Podospora didyma]|uniref:Uncharacterized protein n=1 Tax=Podospora didyma TaxID=330526 RepID=A0AAE0U927_9PEZI|nr:hypothetical protein B0H63DRAFT_63507 [Podospora didyma]
MIWCGHRSLPQPARVPTDKVVPVYFFDDFPSVRDIVMRWMVCFDDVLDAEKLHAALVKLLERDSWRRLGGRLRVNKHGKLELHVPQQFDAQRRPAVRFSHRVSADINLADHPLAPRIPRPTDGPSLQGGGGGLQQLALGTADNLPQTLADYTSSDEPPIALQVITFRDATLVTLNYSHILMDAVGLSAFITAWCAVLAGRDDDVLPLADHDPLEAVGTSSSRSSQVSEPEEEKEEHVLKSKQLPSIGLFFFIVRFVLDLLFGPAMESRVIFLPNKTVQRLKERAANDLEPDHPFISDGDVLSAWGAKMTALGLGPSCTRPLTIFNVFELRGRLPSVFRSPTSVAYVQNAIFVLSIPFTAKEAQTMPLGQMALRFRAAVAAQTTEPQVHAMVREQRAAIAKYGRPPVFAEASSIILPFTNWQKARFFDILDFGPAVVVDQNDKEKGGTRQNQSAPGKPVFFYAFDPNPKPNPTLRHTFNIVGKDRQGNHWVSGILSPATWSTIEDELKNL